MADSSRTPAENASRLNTLVLPPPQPDAPGSPRRILVQPGWLRHSITYHRSLLQDCFTSGKHHPGELKLIILAFQLLLAVALINVFPESRRFCP